MPPAGRVGNGHARGPVRALRAATFAVAAVCLAAAAHLAGGGVLPSWPTLALLALPLAWGCVALTARLRGRAVLALSLGTAQLLLHEAFMALSASPAASAGCAALSGTGPTSAMAGMPGMAAMGGMAGANGVAGMAHGATVPGLCGSGAGALVPTMAHTGALLPGRPMLLAHVLATVLVALVLAHGERLVVAVSGLLGRALFPRSPGPVVAVVRRPRAMPAWAPATALRQALLDTTPMRGPPVRRGVAVAT